MARSCGESRSCIHSRNGRWHSVLPGRVFDCNPRVCLSVRLFERGAAIDPRDGSRSSSERERATLTGCSSSNRGVSDPRHSWRQKRLQVLYTPSRAALFLLITVSARCAKATHRPSPFYPHLRDCEITVCLSPLSFFFFFETLSFSIKCNFMNSRNFVYFYSTFPFCIKTHGKDFADICFVYRKSVGNILRRLSKHYNFILFESVVNLQIQPSVLNFYCFSNEYIVNSCFILAILDLLDFYFCVVCLINIISSFNLKII